MIGCWNTGVFSWDDPQQRQLCLDSLDNWHSGQNEPWAVESIECPPPSDCAQNSKRYTVTAVTEHVPMEVGASCRHRPPAARQNVGACEMVGWSGNATYPAGCVPHEDMTWEWDAFR
jgi:hypothetical protein